LKRIAYKATTIPVCFDAFGAIITSICRGFGLIGFLSLDRFADPLPFDCLSIDRVQAVHFYRQRENLFGQVSFSQGPP
jgi:hypothetical protein